MREGSSTLRRPSLSSGHKKRFQGRELLLLLMLLMKLMKLMVVQLIAVHHEGSCSSLMLQWV